MKLILILSSTLLFFSANTAWADIKMNCSVYQDNKLLTTQEKTLTSQQLNSSWANNHPDLFANNFYKQSLCKSVGLAKDRQTGNAVVRGVKYHNVTVYNNESVAATCKVKCVKADNNTAPAEKLNTLDNHEQNMSTLSAATGYITGITTR